MRMGKAIALLSGGLDSGVALALWRDAGNTALLAVFCDYGQRAAGPEQRAAAALASRLRVPFACVALPWLGELCVAAGSALVDRRRDLPVGTMANPGDQQSAAAVWVPARNAVLVSIGAAHAETLGADTVIAGFNREEAATFPDNSPEFVAAAGSFLGYGTRAGVRLASPTLAMDKLAIGAAARRLGFTADDFWSCYAGGPSPCGHCESCARSLRAWRQE
jgi:7-cyano-7-deazaguanine synthase